MPLEVARVTDDVILPVKKPLWWMVGFFALANLGLAVIIAVTGGSVKVSVFPAPLLGVVAAISGLAGLRLAGDFLSADFLLRISEDGLSGWSQAGGLGSYRARRFDFAWDVIRSVGIVKRWSVPQVMIVGASGDRVFVNANYIKGFSLSDADVVAALITDRRPAP